LLVYLSKSGRKRRSLYILFVYFGCVASWESGIGFREMCLSGKGFHGQGNLENTGLLL